MFSIAQKIVWNIKSLSLLASIVMWLLGILGYADEEQGTLNEEKFMSGSMTFQWNGDQAH